MTAFHSDLTAAVANEHRQDLMRAAANARLAAAATGGDRFRTVRMRPVWWTRVTTSIVVPRIAPTGA